MNHSRLWRAVAIAGFLSLTGGVLIARQASPDGYELSIYVGTPLVTWIGFAMAVCSIVGLCIGSDHRPAQLSGIGLALMTAFCFAALPVIRGYYLYARSDTFGQIGWIRDFVAGFEIPDVLLYPASHVLATELTLVAGMAVTRIVMLLVPIFVVLFCICTELTSRRITPGRHHLGSGVLVGGVLAPIMTVQLPNLQMTPLTLAVFYVAFVGLVLTLYLLDSDDWRTSVILFISLPSLVLLHPLVAVTIASFLGGFAVFRLATPHSLSTNQLPAPFRVLLGAGAVLGILIFLQIFDNPVFQGTVSQTLIQILTGIDVTGGVADRAGGLGSIGVSLWEILLKLFTSKIVVSTFAAVVVLRSMWSHISTEQTRSTELILIYALSLIPIGGLAVLVFAAGRLNLVTRYGAITLVILSVFAAIGIGIVRSNRRSTHPVVIGLGLAIVLTIGVAAPALFTSPYIYQDTPHVPQSEQAGYATLFEHRAETVSVGSTRSLVQRHRTVYHGQRGVRGFDGHQSNSEAVADIESDRPESYFFPYRFNQENPSDTINEPTYLVLPESDREVDLELYDGLRYTQTDYVRIATDTNGAHIYSSNGFDIYHIIPAGR